MIRSSSKNSLASTVSESFQTNDGRSIQPDEASITSKNILDLQQHFEELNKKRENLLAIIKAKTERVIELCKNECTLTGVMPEDYNKLNIKNPFKLTQNILRYNFLDTDLNQFEEKKRNMLMAIDTLNNIIPHLKKSERKEKDKEIVRLRDNLRVLERDHAYSISKKRSSSFVDIHRLDEINEVDNGDVKKSKKMGSIKKMGGLLDLHNFNEKKMVPDLVITASNKDEEEGTKNDYFYNSENEEEEDKSEFRNPSPINQSDSSVSESESAILNLHPGITKTPASRLKPNESSITSSSSLTTSPILINSNTNCNCPDQNFRYQQQHQYHHNHRFSHHNKQLYSNTNSSSTKKAIDKSKFQKSTHSRHNIASTKGQTLIKGNHLNVNLKDSADALDSSSSSASGSSTSDISDFNNNQEDMNKRKKLCKLPNIRKTSPSRNPICRDSKEIMKNRRKQKIHCDIVDFPSVFSKTSRDNDARLSTSFEDLLTQIPETNFNVVNRDSREIFMSKRRTKINFRNDDSHLISPQTSYKVRDNDARLSTSFEDLPTQIPEIKSNVIYRDSREIFMSKRRTKISFRMGDSHLITPRTLQQIRDNNCRLSTSLDNLHDIRF